ncbi:ABC-type phosphate/phosphonate transport system, periplasmic component [Candidatus Terasakiella magnetica]|nr:ABC-type phosphate/phosphonate transport system, periplasmic component [Candidatus Terasakiella magnetica]
MRFVRQIIVLIGLLGLPVQPSLAAALEPAPIRVGLLPTIAPLSLLRLYDPLRIHLQKQLGRPVELYSAPNFRAYLQDIEVGTFDVVISAPHFGVVALDGGYVPLARYKLDLSPLIIVPKGSQIKRVRQLAGKRVLTADRLSALSVVAEHWLMSDAAMRAGRDYSLIEASNHATAIRAVAMGDAEAAFSGLSPLQQVPAEIRAKVDSIPCPLVVPHQFTMAHPRLGAGTVEKLRAALAGFADTEEGRAFFKASGFLGFVPLEIAEIESIRPYAQIVRSMTREKE